MNRFLLVCLGGAVGSGCRYLTALWAAAAFGTAFPFGTLIVNVVGSCLLGFLMHIGTSSELLSDTMRLALTTGVMGGFTTYSTFNYETIRQLQDGAWPLALSYVGATVLGCLVAGWGGIALARAIWGG